MTHIFHIDQVECRKPRFLLDHKPSSKHSYRNDLITGGFLRQCNTSKYSKIDCNNIISIITKYMSRLYSIHFDKYPPLSMKFSDVHIKLHNKFLENLALFVPKYVGILFFYPKKQIVKCQLLSHNKNKRKIFIHFGTGCNGSSYCWIKIDNPQLVSLDCADNINNNTLVDPIVQLEPTEFIQVCPFESDSNISLLLFDNFVDCNNNCNSYCNLKSMVPQFKITINIGTVYCKYKTKIESIGILGISKNLIKDIIDKARSVGLCMNDNYNIFNNSNNNKNNNNNNNNCSYSGQAVLVSILNDITMKTRDQSATRRYGRTLESIVKSCLCDKSTYSNKSRLTKSEIVSHIYRQYKDHDPCQIVLSLTPSPDENNLHGKHDHVFKISSFGDKTKIETETQFKLPNDDDYEYIVFMEYKNCYCCDNVAYSSSKTVFGRVFDIDYAYV